MPRLLAAYLATLLALAVLDYVWLGLVARSFIKAQIGALMLERPHWPSAAVFYLMYAGAIVFFAIAPALEAASWRRALGVGAVLGLVAFATYDLTNLATLKGWTVPMAVVDMAWGTGVTGAAALAGFAAARLLAAS